MRTLTVVLLFAVSAFADTITFRDGRTVTGSYLGGDARNVRVAIGDRVENYPVDRISTIQFGDGTQESANLPPPPPQQPPPPPAGFAASPAPPAAPPNGILLDTGTKLVIRMIDAVDSDHDYVGKSYRASLDEPVVDANGNTVIPRGSDVNVKLVDDKQAGKLEGKTVLTLDLMSIQVNGKMVDINTSSVTEQSASRTARSGKVIGGTAVLGTIIGALAGGGKGAAIGAASGAAVGTGAELATKGQRVRVPSETRLTFQLQQPVQL